MDLNEVALRTSVSQYGRVALLEIPDFEERKLLCRLMQPEEIWQNFLLDEPPKPGKLNLEFVNGYLDGFFVRFEPEAAIVGFILLNTAKKKHDGSVEVLIAVTDPETRKKKIALEACLALFHHTLDKGDCESLWAFLDKENFPSEGLIRSLGVTIIDRNDGNRRLGREDDHIEVRLTKEEWVQLKQARGLVFD